MPAPRNAIAFEVADRHSPEARTPGAYSFMRRYDTELNENVGDPIGIVHACPCGCGGQSAIWFTGGSSNGEGGHPEHEWKVTGSWPKVTLSPSIGIGRGQGASADRTKGTSGGFHWHGYLTDGIFEEK
jgi:hypothetical protein